MNPAFQYKELEFCLNKTRIKCIICADNFKTTNSYDVLKKVVPEITNCEFNNLTSQHVPSLKHIIVISKKKFRGTISYDEVRSLANAKTIDEVTNTQKSIDCHDVFNIQLTSGTTGFPKFVAVSHFQILNNCYFIARRLELNRKQHIFCYQIPLFHAFGLLVNIAALHFGSTLVFPSSVYSAEKTLDAIKENNCSIIVGTPTMFVDLIDLQTKRKEDIQLDIAVSGGASGPVQLFENILKILRVKKIQSIYGLTEASSVFYSLPGEDVRTSVSTVGCLMDHTEAKVIDSASQIVPFGSPGELCLRGYSVIKNYLDDDEKSTETIDADGWFHTGDQFIIHENGYGQIVGRLKEIINRGGEKIYPKEIEDVLISHPDILEVHVVGLPDKRLGEKVCACIRTKFESTLTQEDIKKYCIGIISQYKIPSEIKIMESFPKTTSGKIQKSKLVQIIQNGIKTKSGGQNSLINGH